jgi:membrane protease YdiL (CAAX protease family)
MQLIENPLENRLRAPFRLSFFILGMVILWVFSGAMKGLLSEFGPNWLMTPISYLITVLLSTGLVYVTGKWVDLRSFRSFGLQLNRLWIRELIEGVLITSCVVLLVYVVGVLFGFYDITGFRPGMVNPGKWITSLVGYFVVMASVSYYEELLFRGYLTLNLFEGIQRDLLKSRAAAIGSTLIISSFFAFVHANNPNATWLGVTNILLAGFMLGIPYLISGSLAMPIGIHFAWNFVQGPILGIPVSGIIFPTSLLQTDSLNPILVSGGTFGLEGGLLGTTGIVLILLVVILIFRKRYNISLVNPAISTQAVVRQRQPV